MLVCSVCAVCAVAISFCAASPFAFALMPFRHSKFFFQLDGHNSLCWLSPLPDRCSPFHLLYLPGVAAVGRVAVAAAAVGRVAVVLSSEAASNLSFQWRQLCN